jgi:hypothetical protein
MQGGVEWAEDDDGDGDNGEASKWDYREAMRVRRAACAHAGAS